MEEQVSFEIPLSARTRFGLWWSARKFVRQSHQFDGHGGMKNKDTGRVTYCCRKGRQVEKLLSEVAPGASTRGYL